ncbi:MAG: carboxylating nicotinate-nucleotide diphosphorylase [Candidatus Bathyarchaeia archaeon]
MKKEDAYLRDLTPYKRRIISRALLALKDDIGRGDITTLATLPNVSREEDAIIVVKESGVLGGVLEARAILEAGGLQVQFLKEQGEMVEKGEVIAKIHGDVKQILCRERTALDYLQVMSGIATACHRLAKRFPGKVASLRKTHPCLAFSEKMSVRAGGALTHRLGLFDGFLIKDNHLAAVARELFGGSMFTEEQKAKAIHESLRRVEVFRRRHRLSRYFIEVEVESMSQALVAARYFHERGIPDMILLDNMDPSEVTRCVKAIREIAGPNILIEASGGITEANIELYIEAGVDVVSMSSLTLNARPLDISLKIVGYK